MPPSFGEEAKSYLAHASSAANLPENMCETVCSFLGFDEYGKYGCASAALHKFCTKILARIDKVTVVKDSWLAKGGPALYRCLSALRVLEVWQLASDEFLRNLTGALPNLTVLRCMKSPQVSDEGLGGLLADRHFRRALKELDLTQCRNTSYGITIRLRRMLPSLQLIRRQPAHLDGQFVTPFGGAVEETHTYYADGSFDFSRHEQSRGYVRFFEERQCTTSDGLQDTFLTDSLQYCNFDGVDMGWPDFAKFLYRPGVAVREGNVACATGNSVKSVLVAQNVRGMFAPDVWPPIPDEEVPIGERFFLNEADERLSPDIRMDEALSHGASTMLSRMEVRHLQTLMPPDELVDEIEAFEHTRLEFESRFEQERLQKAEATLHIMLGGS